MGLKSFAERHFPWMVQDPLQAGGEIPGEYQKTAADQERIDRSILTFKEPAAYIGSVALGKTKPEN